MYSQNRSSGGVDYLDVSYLTSAEKMKIRKVCEDDLDMMWKDRVRLG